ncbi:MAG: hypothetical protein Q4F01_09320 [Staphylococcus rostri]|uniref:hypothetical protein n=1 Tax=Staphylococcus rostri TaxID=522262 RepID=UPI0026DEF0A5|nr:hypothetical protein [Staphylococcus rostri]MDO5376365.1 hypothetical protein [Staphylococcus rostri]
MEGFLIIVALVILSAIYNICNKDSVKISLKQKFIKFHIKRIRMSNDLRHFIITGEFNENYKEHSDYINALIHEIEDVRNLRISSHSIVSSIFVSFSVAFTSIIVTLFMIIVTLYTNTIGYLNEKQLDIYFEQNKDLNEQIQTLDITSSEMTSKIMEYISNFPFFIFIIGASSFLSLFPLAISKIIIRYGITGVFDKRLIILREMIYEDLKAKDITVKN